MNNITGSIVGSSLIVNTVLVVGPLYQLSVPVYNQESIVSITDNTNTTYPIYVGSTSPITPGYISPSQGVYFSFDGTICEVVPKNPYVQVYADVQTTNEVQGLLQSGEFSPVFDTVTTASQTVTGNQTVGGALTVQGSASAAAGTSGNELVNYSQITDGSLTPTFGVTTVAVGSNSNDAVNVGQATALLTSGTTDVDFAAINATGAITQTPGAGANNSTPLAQYGDLFSDAIVSGLTTATSSSLTGTLAAGVAYVLGQRVVYPGGTYTVAASSTSYLDLSDTGVLTVSTSDTVTANSLRLLTVTSSSSAITAITGVAYTAPTVKHRIKGFVSVLLGTQTNLAINAITTIPFDIVAEDPDGCFNVSTNSYVAPEDGIYMMSAALHTGGSIPAGSEMAFWFSTPEQRWQAGDGIAPIQEPGAAIFPLNAGDGVQIQVYQGSNSEGSSTPVGYIVTIQGDTWWTAAKIGDLL